MNVVSDFGRITIVPPSGALISSGFLLDTEGWTIAGNKAISSSVAFEPYSRGQLLNHYIIG